MTTLVEAAEAVRKLEQQQAKERPILFNGAMVRAILSGQKTQTRRVVKHKWPHLWQEPWYATGRVLNDLPNQPGAFMEFRHRSHDAEGYTGSPASTLVPCPYGKPGDRLIVASEIPGVGSAYCAGSDGVVYSRARGEWRPLKSHTNTNGYHCVTVMIDGRKTTRAVHSLVCAAFYGPAPFEGAQVRHLDGNPQHNTPENLCWGSQAENWQDRRAHGNGVEGEKHHAAKLTDDERSHLRWAIEKGLCSQRHAAKMLNITQSAIWQVMQGSELRPTMQPDAGLRIPCIVLEIVSVRVERLQNISEADAKAEGTDASHCFFDDGACKVAEPYRTAFGGLWASVYGKESWLSNPWVWVVEFRKVAA